MSSNRLRALILAGLGLPLLAHAAVTAVGAAPQSNGVPHTLRTIPEACVRVQGQFTGQATSPYAMAVVPLGGGCQPRARFAGEVDTAMTAAGSGWHPVQVIKVPAADCPGQVMEFELWQHDGGAHLPARDGQGQARVYLEQARQPARAGQLARLPAYAVRTSVTAGPQGCA